MTRLAVILIAVVTLSAAAEEGKPEGPGIVDASTLVPRLQVELEYATDDNFLGKNVYGGLSKCYLHEDAAKMLARADGELHRLRPDLRLHAWDCLRPRRVQLMMWEVVKGTDQQAYVANPHSKTGSIHNYGCAIDLTLADEDGRTIDMGTKFDHFGKLAHPREEIRFRSDGKLTADQLANRLLLRLVMSRAGFLPLSNEWWHFNCATPKATRRKYRLIE